MRTDASPENKGKSGEKSGQEWYDARSIKVLKGLEGVRKRPAMYIGDTAKRGLHHILEEVVDNSIDEHLAGFCDHITVTIHDDGHATVEDNGRGIPVDMHPEMHKPALEIVMTTLHAGGKFDTKSYRISGGLHGVGVSVTNALSEWLKAEVKRNGRAYSQKYMRGKAVSELKVGKKTDETGTLITFKADPKIFSETDFDYELLVARLEELSFLNAGLKIDILDERSGKHESFIHAGGIKSFVKHLNKTKSPIHPEPVYFSDKKPKHELEVAMQYTDGYVRTVYSFVNGINTIEGGTHQEGWRSALTRALNKYIEEKGSMQLKGEDVREGLTAVISLRLQNPQFEGQTKTKLGNSDVRGIVASVTYEKLTSFLEENPQVRNIIITKVLEAAKAREAARQAKELVRRKSAFSTGSLPGKLADCQVRDPKKAELFIVEGDSAGGCFSGDTKVALVDGRNLSFKDLVEENKKGKSNYCYTIDNDGLIRIGLIKNPRRTKKNAEVIKLFLDNGEAITCTPDHRFMLRDGSYLEANRLKNDISIMPLCRKLSKIEGRIKIKGYEMVLNPKTHKWILTHLLSDRYNIASQRYEPSSGDCRHHIDFNKLNNNPENIMRMGKQEHLDFHVRTIEKTAHREDIKQKCREVHKSPEYRKKVSEIMSTPEMRNMLSQRAKKQWENDQYKKFMVKKFLEFYKTNKQYRERTRKILLKANQGYWSKEGNREKQAERVIKYFENNPEARKQNSDIAKRQWSNPELRKWRSEKTKEQWTKEFREKRKKAYNRTYFKHTAGFMKQILENDRNLNVYDVERIRSRNKNLLRLDTFTERFFGNDEKAMIEAVMNYNHKIRRIENIKKKMDVYDLEVEGTHNFALTSGVFVHNSSRQGRDRKFQAVLPLRGKILNTEKARIDKIYENNEISAMMTAIGTGINDECDAKKSRYGKIMILADSDVDGNHIVTLILTFFYRYMQPLIKTGKIYVANAPLYRIKHKNKVHYVFDEREKNRLLQKMGEKGVLIQRFKGLGEMNPAQLWETTLNPETRRLKQITIEDAMLADEIFSTLMGKEVVPRREFIVKHSKAVKNLDI